MRSSLVTARRRWAQLRGALWGLLIMTTVVTFLARNVRRRADDDPRPPGVPTEAPKERCAGLRETLVQTVCGEAALCGDERVPRSLNPDHGGRASTDGFRRLCFQTLQEALIAVGHALPYQPPVDLEWPTAPTKQCGRPGFSVLASATRSILERVRAEGDARSGDAATRASIKRFDFTEWSASCRVDGSFFVEVSSGTGAPGALPYHALWRVDQEGAPEPVYEHFDVLYRQRIEPAGDVDGDGYADWLVRKPTDLPDDDTSEYTAQFTVATLAQDQPIPVAKVKVVASLDADDQVTPKVQPVLLTSGAVVAVDGVPHRIRDGVLRALPELSDELRAAQRQPDLRQELLHAPPDWDEAEPCNNAVRIAWAERVAGPLEHLLGRRDAVVALAGLWACPLSAPL